MAEFTLAQSQIRAGRWTGSLIGAGTAQPQVEVTHLQKPLPGVEVTGADGHWSVSVVLPAEILSDGVQTLLVRETATDTELGHFSIVAGVTTDEDIRAEISLLRAELDMLKKAFRRHCLDTGA